MSDFQHAMQSATDTIADLEARNAALIAALQRCEEQGERIIRMRIALLLARDWTMGGEGYSADVQHTLKEWIDGDTFPPLPWPKSPFIQEWCHKKGMENVNGNIGYSFQAKAIATD